MGDLEAREAEGLVGGAPGHRPEAPGRFPSETRDPGLEPTSGPGRMMEGPRLQGGFIASRDWGQSPHVKQGSAAVGRLQAGALQRLAPASVSPSTAGLNQRFPEVPGVSA